jgi:DNA-directed RNA polymerase specialized sigma24 family protein
VASARRELLLRVHGHRLRREDLEDCYSQAVLEMVLRSRRAPFANVRHLANALEQRFLSRIYDRRRALAGRSPMQAALETAVPFGEEGEELEIRDPLHEPERLAVARQELRWLTAAIRELSPDQRRALGAQIAGIDPGEVCASTGWTPEKYRKTAQRARSRLRRLACERETAEASGSAAANGSAAADGSDACSGSAEASGSEREPVPQAGRGSEMDARNPSYDHLSPHS